MTGIGEHLSIGEHFMTGIGEHFMTGMGEHLMTRHRE